MKKLVSLRIRIPTLMVLGMILISSAIISISFKRYEELNIQKHIKMADGITELMAKELDTGRIDEYIKYNYSMPEYDEILKTYYTIKDSYLDVTYMYVYRFYKDDDGRVKGTVVIDLDEKYSKDVPQESIDWVGDIYVADTTFADDYDTIVFHQTPTWHIVRSRKEEGETGKRLRSYIKPVSDKNGNYICSVCVDFSLDAIFDKGHVFIIELLATITIIGALIIAFIDHILNKILLTPVRKLTEGINALNYETDSDRRNNIRVLESLNIHTDNEIDLLYNALLRSEKDSVYYIDSLARSQEELKEVNEVVSKDALTGVRSKPAYLAYAEKLNKEIIEKTAKYAIVMVDINNLKYVNDKYGHERGDKYIKNCTKIICDIYKHAPVFRIGGDEFVIILTEGSYNEREALLEKARSIFKTYADDATRAGYERYSVSLGMATFTPGTDNTHTGVFVRADRAMYAEKAEYKKSHGSYR